MATGNSETAASSVKPKKRTGRPHGSFGEKRLGRNVKIGVIPVPDYFGALAGRKRNFIAAFINGGYTTARACEAAGITRSTYSAWMNGRTIKNQKPQQPDQLFIQAKAWADEYLRDSLEQEAIRRGKDGYDKPIYYKGERVDTIKEYSDQLLMFVLKKVDPAYREKSTQEINVNLHVDVAERLRRGRALVHEKTALAKGTQQLIPANNGSNSNRQ